MLDSEFFRFESGALVPCHDQVSEIRLAAADSFLVESGSVRSLQQHLDRFANWVSVASPALSLVLPAYFESALSLIPLEGRWFPRFELHLASPDGGPREDSLYLRLRTAPDQLGELILWTLDEPDPRLTPEIKGPDLSLCMQLRRKAQLHGADEAVLLDGSGAVVEGALSSLVWWRGDLLCAPDNTTSWLNSVTRNEVFAIAASMGIQTRLERAKPGDLVGLEIWALSSLQGIRSVSSWIGLGSPVGVEGSAAATAQTRLEQFQKRLRLYARMIR